MSRTVDVEAIARAAARPQLRGSPDRAIRAALKEAGYEGSISDPLYRALYLEVQQRWAELTRRPRLAMEQLAPRQLWVVFAHGGSVADLATAYNVPRAAAYQRARDLGFEWTRSGVRGPCCNGCGAILYPTEMHHYKCVPCRRKLDIELNQKANERLRSIRYEQLFLDVG